jgi:hypothetical protein
MGVMARREGVAEAAFDFGADDEGAQQRFAGCGCCFGISEERWGDGRGRMDDGCRVGIVEVGDVGCHRIDVGAKQHVSAFGPADDAAMFAAGEVCKHDERFIDGRFARASEGSGEAVEDCAFGFAADLVGNIAPLGFASEGGDAVGDGASGVGLETVMAVMIDSLW